MELLERNVLLQCGRLNELRKEIPEQLRLALAVFLFAEGLQKGVDLVQVEGIFIQGLQGAQEWACGLVGLVGRRRLVATGRLIGLGTLITGEWLTGSRERIC